MGGFDELDSAPTHHLFVCVRVDYPFSFFFLRSWWFDADK